MGWDEREVEDREGRSERDTRDGIESEQGGTERRLVLKMLLV